MKFSYTNAVRWDEKLGGGEKSSVLRKRQKIKTIGNLIPAGAKLQLRLLLSGIMAWEVG